MRRIEKLIDFTRTTILSIVIVLLFAQSSMAQSDTLSFLHISDVHMIFDIEQFQKDIAQSRSLYSNGVKPFKKFLKKVPGETGSDFVIVTGDLIDIYEGEKAGGGKLETQAGQFARIVDKCKTPVFLTLGNHDIASYSWKDSARVTSQIYAERARATWIKSAACFNEGSYYSRNFKVGGTSYRLIFLDNGYNMFPPESNIKNPYVDKSQLYWLEDQLQQSVDDIEIILMHIPITSESVQQEPSNEFYSLLAKNPSVKLVLAGHNHKNAIKVFPSAENNKITQVQTGGFGQNDENWRVIRLTENKILVSHPGEIEKEMEILIQ